jgi:hypothetical protein
MAEYVVPMMTRGISQHWETMAGAMGETAVYASLQITLYIARLLSDPFLTGFPVTNEKQTGGLFWETADNDLANFGHAQYSFDTGYCICAILLFMNIMTAVGVRQQSSKRVSL